MKKHLQIKMKVIFWGPKDNEKLLRFYKFVAKNITKVNKPNVKIFIFWKNCFWSLDNKTS